MSYDDRTDILEAENTELKAEIEKLNETIAIREELGKFPIQGISRAKYLQQEVDLQEKTNENS